MITRAKRTLKRAIIRWQLEFLLVAIAAQFLLMGTLLLAVPKISNATQALITAAQALVLLVVMMADVIKTDDTEE